MSAPTLTVYDRIGDWVDNHLDESIAFLRELLRVPTDTPPGDNARHAARTADLMTRMGFIVERHPVPQADVDVYGLISITNLVVRRRFGDGPLIALNVNGDTMPPGAGWTHPPYAGDIADGRIYGCGAAESKSDIATYVYALRALSAEGALHRGGIELHVTYDREFGGRLGPQWLLAHNLADPDYALCPGSSYEVGVAHTGCIRLEVIMHGHAAQAAVPATGVDTLHAANVLLDALHHYAGEHATMHSRVSGIDTPALNVERIDGGIDTDTDIAPDRIGLRLDRRVIPEESVIDAEYDLRAAVERTARMLPGITIEVRRLLRANALTALPGHEQLVAALQRHARAVIGEDIPARGAPHFSDARLYGECGIPTVLYGAGPRTPMEANAKGADENLVLEDLRKATKVVACALHDLLEQAPGRKRQRPP